jgi:hypothetical protein
VPCGFDGLGTVVGIFAGDALAPADDAVNVRFEEEDAAVIGHTAADLERSNQLHSDFA